MLFVLRELSPSLLYVVQTYILGGILRILEPCMTIMPASPTFVRLPHEKLAENRLTHWSVQSTISFSQQMVRPLTARRAAPKAVDSLTPA